MIDGSALGFDDGRSLGSVEGCSEGPIVGCKVGICVLGSKVGIIEG